jgi:PAS domain S-box-containing protein
MLAGTTEDDRRGRTRNRCNSEGFESVALIPLRSGREIIGLLQLNDRQRGKIRPGLVPFLEEIASTIGIALKRKQGEQLARQLAAIVESSEDAIIGTDLDGTITSWNAGAQRLYGYTAAEAIGARALMLIPSERLAEFDDIFATIRSDECVHQLETVRRRKDGRPVDVSMSVSPIHGPDGRVIGASAIARDITERKRAAEQQRRLEGQLQQAQKLESLGVLAGGIAHDFNNLLVGILGNAELVWDATPADAPAREPLERIRRSANRAADLTKQMLAYSGKGQFVVEPLDLSSRVREMSELLNASMSKSVRLHKQLAEDLPRIEADAAQMSQVIMNLITNASEAIGDGGGTCSLRTGVMEVDAGYLDGARVGADAPAGRYVYIEVSDSGCGMDEETAARIFEPFFTTKFTGRGLGLAAVLGIVRGHHGAIKVESAPGRGTTIRVLFPVTGQSARTRTSLQQLPPAGSGARIVLVVDDEEEVRSVAKEILERDGFRVLLAEDGREAQAMYRAHADDIDVVLLDLTMPHADGEVTLGEIRRVRNDAAVVLSSGYTAEDVSRRFAGVELSGFLQKPYTAQALTAVVRAAIADEHHPRPQARIVRVG